MNKKEQALPQRSAGGLAAMDIFYRGFNEVNFYVEDSDQENLYYEILRKLFPDVRLEKIFPLGGKHNVIGHAKDDSNAEIQHRVYILDKDFDDLLEKKEVIENVYYLERFCIENYMIDEDALIEFVVETEPKLTRHQIRYNLSLETVLPLIAQDLRELFAIFFLVQKEELGLPNCREKPEKFCIDKKLWKSCSALIGEYLDRVNAALDEKGLERVEGTILDDDRFKEFRDKDSFIVISGKFWLAMIFHYLKSKYRLGSISFSSFVFRVAKNCEFSTLDDFAADVKRKIA